MSYTAEARETSVDSEVWNQAASGDDSAIAALYRTYGPALVAYAAARSTEDPEGIANMAFYDGIRALPNLRQRCEPVFRAYIYRAVRSRIVGEQRRSKLNTVPLADEMVKDPVRSAAPIDERLAADSGFEQLLDQVTPAQRDVLAHRFLAGYSVNETATRLNRSPEAVRQLQQRGIIRLRTMAALVAVLIIGAAAIVLARGDAGVVTDLPVDQPPVESGPDQIESAPDDQVIQIEVDDAQDSSSSSTTTTSSTTTEAVTAATTTVVEEAGTTLCFDLVGDLAHHSLIGLGTCSGAVTQQVTFMAPDEDRFGQVRIGNVLDNCLHVQSNSNDDGAPVETNVCGQPGDNTKWKLVDGRLLSLSTDKCLTVSNGAVEPGAILVLMPCGDVSNQRFVVEQPSGDGSQLRLVS